MTSAARSRNRPGGSGRGRDDAGAPARSSPLERPPDVRDDDQMRAPRARKLTPDDSGLPPLHHAAWLGDADTIRAQVAAGANVDGSVQVSVGGQTRISASPLQIAAGSSAGATVDTLRLLVELGAKPDRSWEGRTALRFAVGGYDVTRELTSEIRSLSADPTRNLGGRSGLRPSRETAKRGGDVDRIRYLLDHGCYADEIDFDDVPILAEAAYIGDPARVALLLEYGAPPDSVELRSVDPDGFRVVRHLDLTVPLFAAAAGGVGVLEPIVADGAYLKLRDAQGNTALYFARDAETARWLVERGLDIERRTSGDMTPLMRAASDGAVDSARALLGAGADPNATHDHGLSVLMVAAGSIERSTEMLKVLVEHGADPHATSAFGWNVLHAAIDVNGAEPNEEAHVREIFTYLYALKVSRKQKDARGWTPWDRAGVYGSKSVIEVMRELESGGHDAHRSATGPYNRRR